MFKCSEYFIVYFELWQVTRLQCFLALYYTCSKPTNSSFKMCSLFEITILFDFNQKYKVDLARGGLIQLFIVCIVVDGLHITRAIKNIVMDRRPCEEIALAEGLRSCGTIDRFTYNVSQKKSQLLNEY